MYAVRVLLRNKETGLYLAGIGREVGASRHALDFPSLSQAAKFALEQQVPDLEIVLSYANEAHQVPLPLLPEWHELEQRRAAA